MRDALRGPFSDNNKGAFLIGEKGHEESIKFGLVGCIEHPEVDMEQVNYSKQAWTSQPTQSINYVSCHDDMMLTDRLKANKKLKAESWRVATPQQVGSNCGANLTRYAILVVRRGDCTR